MRCAINHEENTTQEQQLKNRKAIKANIYSELESKSYWMKVFKSRSVAWKWELL